MNKDKALRNHLQKLLSWQDAHVGFDSAIEGIPPELRGIQPQGFPYSCWQILEHIRICQFDILDFARNPEYKEQPMSAYWPKTIAPPALETWDQSIASFYRDRKALEDLAHETTDLFASIPHGTGQTYLRELLLAADHNAYHTADLVALRRVLGIWH